MVCLVGGTGLRFEGHLDSSQRQRASTLTCRVVSCVHWDCCGMCSSSGFPRDASHPAHYVYACCFTRLAKHRSAFVAAVWSRWMDLANSGAIPCLLDGPAGCDPGFHVLWCMLWMIRRFCLANLVKLVESIKCCTMFLVLDMGLFTYLLKARASLVYIGAVTLTGGKCLGYLAQVNVADPIQHLTSAIID